MRVVADPLLEWRGVVECFMGYRGRGDEDGAEGGGGRVFDLEVSGDGEAGYCWAGVRVSNLYLIV